MTGHRGALPPFFYWCGTAPRLLIFSGLLLALCASALLFGACADEVFGKETRVFTENGGVLTCVCGAAQTVCTHHENLATFPAGMRNALAATDGYTYAYTPRDDCRYEDGTSEIYLTRAARRFFS